MTGRRSEGSTTVRGVRMSWTSEGDGPLVLWGHGLSNDRWSMEDAGIFDWEPVARVARLVRFDWRGHGASEGTRDPSDYTWDALADDVLAFIDELSPDAPVRAIGCSMGTGSLLSAAVRAPERFDRLVLTAPPTAWETRAAQGALYRQLADVVETRGYTGLAALMEAMPPTGIFADLPPEQAMMTPRIAEELAPTVFRGAALADLPPQDDVRGLAVPTLILSWTGDPGHPVSTGEALHELLPGSRFAVAGSIAETLAWGGLAADFLAGDER